MLITRLSNQFVIQSIMFIVIDEICSILRSELFAADLTSLRVEVLHKTTDRLVDWLAFICAKV